MASSATGNEVPQRQSDSVAGRGAGPVRSRKETLSSPIPALLATSMGDVEEGPLDPDSVPVLVSGAETSRLEPSVHEALLVKTNRPEPSFDEPDMDRYWNENDPNIP